MTPRLGSPVADPTVVRQTISRVVVLSRWARPRGQFDKSAASRPSSRHAGSMERLARLVVHVEEALRLARYEDEPHLRLALMLLDSAAELILHRSVQLRFTTVKSQLLNTYDRAQQQGLLLDDAA